MTRQKPKSYPHKIFLSTQTIQKEVLELLNSVEDGTYIERLNYLLDSYQNLICSSKFQGGHENFYDVYQDDTIKTINSIKRCVKYYLHGRISSSYKAFNIRWSSLWKDNYTPNVYSLPENEFWYKIRRIEDHPFKKREEYFHIPFEMRGKIGNNRYSISGYPCLYLGKSLYTCWEETRRPKLSELALIAYKVQKPMHLLDMRLNQRIESGEKEMYNIRLLPYILASSLKVYHDDCQFKPEYIIPQLILHSVIKNNLYHGVIFTSTRHGMAYTKSNLALFENLAIPVMSNQKSGYCRRLASFFTASAPTYYELEYLQGKIINNCINDTKGKYQNSVFFSLEDVLKKKDFNDIL